MLQTQYIDKIIQLFLQPIYMNPLRIPSNKTSYFVARTMHFHSLNEDA
jgi:hypothetical protein